MLLPLKQGVVAPTEERNPPAAARASGWAAVFVLTSSCRRHYTDPVRSSRMQSVRHRIERGRISSRRCGETVDCPRRNEMRRVISAPDEAGRERSPRSHIETFMPRNGSKVRISGRRQPVAGGVPVRDWRSPASVAADDGDRDLTHVSLEQGGPIGLNGEIISPAPPLPSPTPGTKMSFLRDVRGRRAKAIRLQMMERASSREPLWSVDFEHVSHRVAFRRTVGLRAQTASRPPVRGSAAILVSYQ